MEHWQQPRIPSMPCIITKPSYSTNNNHLPNFYVNPFIVFLCRFITYVHIPIILLTDICVVFYLWLSWTMLNNIHFYICILVHRRTHFSREWNTGLQGSFRNEMLSHRENTSLNHKIMTSGQINLHFQQWWWFMFKFLDISCYHLF